MPTIVALCPYCRRGGVRASEKMVGAVATCPKCGSQFTVVPRDSETPAVAPAEEETKPHAPMADVTEPSPVLSRKAPSEPAVESSDGVEPAFAGSLIALSLFGLGVLATVFPYGRFIGLGLCGLGLFTALGCLFGDGLARKLAAAGTFVNLVAVMLLALAPTWLGLESLSGPPPSDFPQGPYSLSLSSNEVGGGERVDAGKSLYANGDVRVGVRPGGIQPLELTGPKGAIRRTRENVLKLQLRITNAGVERRIPLTDWAAGNPGEAVKLTDPSGKPIKVKVFDAGWQPPAQERVDGLFPGKSADVLLYFEAPIIPKGGRIDSLQLELPGAAVGLTPESTIRFHIPGQF